MKTKLHSCIIALALLAGIHQAAAQGTTAFTYQGQLHDTGTNANGTYTMIFALYDSASGGSEIGSAITTTPTLANGLFSVNLDYGSNAFNGSARWLDITISNNFVTQTLSPRVQVLPAPYALYAAVAATVTNGAIMNSQLASNSVATTNIQYNAVTNQNLTANAVATTNIQNNAVTNQNLTANAVATTNIQNGAITTAKIATGAVTNQNLAANAVATTNIQNGAVTTAQIAAGAVTNANLTANAVNATNIASGQVVKSLNGLKDSVTLATGANIAIATNGNSLTLSVPANPLTVGDWATGVGSYSGHSDVLTFSQNGSIRALIAPSGIASGDGGDVGMEVFDNLDVDGNFTVPNGIAAFYGDADFYAGAYVSGDLTVTGCINGTFCQSSDKNLKEKFTPIDSERILERVASMSISSWTYKQDANTRHIGPMAQDFYAAFNVGTDDKHIATVDEGGVALAAIQGLNEKLKAEGAQKDAEIKALERRLSDLEQLVKKSTQK